MSDFDEVLERLVTDPAFREALRADPETALGRYRLEPEERELLDAQLDLGSGADHAVEDRVSKSGVFGLVGPVFSGFGLGDGDGSTGTSSIGFRDVGRDDPEGVATMGKAEPEAEVVLGAVAEPGPGPAAVDYHTWVDADGDGRGDLYQAVERGSGAGVDILVDRDGDGQVDFIGHDYDRDGLVDNADYDDDHDGVFDRRLDDIDGDGWLDRSRPYPTESQTTLGTKSEPGAA